MQENAPIVHGQELMDPVCICSPCLAFLRKYVYKQIRDAGKKFESKRKKGKPWFKSDAQQWAETLASFYLYMRFFKDNEALRNAICG